jgi:hypothetical protein
MKALTHDFCSNGARRLRQRAGGGRAFGFDAGCSPGIEILNFRYGASGMPGRGDVGVRRSPQVTGINGPMPLGDTLTVKWRIKAGSLKTP